MFTEQFKLNTIDFLKQKIKPRQELLKDNLIIKNDECSVWTKTSFNLSKGCQCCKSGSWMCVYVGNQCNVSCPYCAQGSNEDKIKRIDNEHTTRNMPIDELKKLITKQYPIVKGISYTGGEPLLYLSKIIELAQYVRDNHQDMYQWMYTNGVLITEDKLKLLADLNIQEIRFHLGATEFSDEVINKMKLAKKYIKHVNVETPSVPLVKEHLIDKNKIYLLEELGVEQINLGEFVVTNDFNKKFVGNDELYFYCSPTFQGTSPIYSRQITYDIMEYAINNNINIIINDCSNEAKTWQQKICRENNIQFFC